MNEHEIEIDDIEIDENENENENEDEIEMSRSFVEPFDKNGEVHRCYADIDDKELDRRTALARLLNINILEVNLVSKYDFTFEAEGRDWMVLTDTEADNAFDEAVENYVYDCMDIPSNIMPYFNMDAYKKDVRMAEGRGPLLAFYDGEEREEYGTTKELLFIYKL